MMAIAAGYATASVSALSIVQRPMAVAMNVETSSPFPCMLIDLYQQNKFGITQCILPLRHLGEHMALRFRTLSLQSLGLYADIYLEN